MQTDPEQTVEQVTRKVPRGYEIAIISGKPKLRKKTSKEPANRTIAFRCQPSVYARLIPFVESFEEREWGTALRWLLDDETVKAVISERIRSQARPARRRTP